jgi:hypothetical protein
MPILAGSTLTLRLAQAPTCVSSKEFRAPSESNIEEGQTMIVEHNYQTATFLRIILDETSVQIERQSNGTGSLETQNQWKRNPQSFRAST